MKSGTRRILVGLVIAAALGFIAGWIAQAALAPSLEGRINQAEKQFREKAQRLVR